MKPIPITMQQVRLGVKVAIVVVRKGVAIVQLTLPVLSTVAVTLREIRKHLK